MLKIITVGLCISFFFMGCSENDKFAKEKQECIKQDKKFKFAERLNYRTGQMELRIICY
jgi:hypothetical protein